MTNTTSAHSLDAAQGPEAQSEHVRCNLCGSDDTEDLYRAPDCRFEIDDVEWRVVRCRCCQLTYLNPRPTEATMWRYYPRKYYEGRDTPQLTERYELQAEHLGDVSPGRLLDIGCANGDWIRLMQARGWQVSGLEPSPNSQNPHQLDIRKGKLPEGLSWTPGSFDVVTSWAVVEHLHNPRVVFEGAHRMLRPGGRLIILVPHARSLSSRYAYQEDLPRHLYMFSRKTLERYAKESRLALTRIAHDPRFFGGTGRGVLRVQLFRLLDKSPRDYFRFMKLRRRERFRRAPILTSALLGLAALERAILTDRVTRALHLSGHIIAHFVKPL